MRNVLLLLSNGLEAYEASCFTDVFGFAKSGGIQVSLTSAGLYKKLTCAYGFKIIPDKLIKEININKFDALVIPGGRNDAGFYRDGSSEAFLEIIKKFNNQGKYIAAICTGAVLLGKSGILKNRRATTYPGKRQKELIKYGATIPKKDLVIDKNIITCSSPHKGLDVSFTLLELLTSKEDRSGTERWFGVK